MNKSDNLYNSIWINKKTKKKIRVIDKASFKMPNNAYDEGLLFICTGAGHNMSLENTLLDAYPIREFTRGGTFAPTGETFKEKE